MSNQSSESNNTLMCILSYFGIFALIPYFTQKDNAYLNWHSRQGLLITAIAIVISFGLSVLTFLPAIGWVAGLASMLFSFAVLALCVFCMIQACNGKKWAVPGLSAFLK
ncbi:MAG: hypothetical protein JNK57_02320 [Planctomycetaceae bacterium]|nr:hypothetical protein [Planctomycetaceae bacterium]